MTITAQNRAIQNYRSRLRKQGVARFEVLALESDRDLIRSLARRLTQNDAMAQSIRERIRASVTETSRKGGILAALRRSPLIGTELQIVRSRETGRKVEL